MQVFSSFPPNEFLKHCCAFKYLPISKVSKCHFFIWEDLAIEGLTALHLSVGYYFGSVFGMYLRSFTQRIAVPFSGDETSSQLLSLSF